MKTHRRGTKRAVSPRWKIKSLGCTQKAGSSVVVDVLRYGERLKTPGLNLLKCAG